MTTDPTEKLIVDLVGGLTPVRRLPSVSVRMIQWLAAAALIAGGAVWLTGSRADLSHAIAAPGVLLSLGLALAASMTAALLALRLSVPGADRSAGLRFVPGAIVAVWVAALVLSARGAGAGWSALMQEPLHAACIGRVVAIAVVPVLLLAREVRRGFALDAVSATALAALGGSALAAMAVQLVCPIDRPAHLLTSHVLPMLAVVITATAVTRVAAPGRQ